MQFSLNDFLQSVSFALDFVEMDRLGTPSDHGKRVAYIALYLARGFGFSREERYDLASLGMLHDNGISESSLYEQLHAMGQSAAQKFEGSKAHCEIGEENVKEYPFLTHPHGILLYHHEHFDGSGFYGLKGDEIPLMARIIAAADQFETRFHLSAGRNSEAEFPAWIDRSEGHLFSHEIAQAFRSAEGDAAFWNSLREEETGPALMAAIPTFRLEMSFERIQKITRVFSRIIDSKSRFTQRHSLGLAEKAARMADYYGKPPEERIKLIIAADLHDLGKLAVPNSILDSPRGLTKEDFEIVKKHVYYTRVALQNINGFEDITEWAANHHEKLDGSGYPFGKTGAELDFNSRLMGCLDIYQALTEERPYREGMSHRSAMEILYQMVSGGKIDAEITDDLNTALAP